MKWPRLHPELTTVLFWVWAGCGLAGLAANNLTLMVIAAGAFVAMLVFGRFE